MIALGMLAAMLAVVVGYEVAKLLIRCLTAV
jgi:hypothetical protein